MTLVYKENRSYQYDTMRFILMFLVIVAHAMEQFNQDWVSTAYRIIYTFHMPAFIFLAGKFAVNDGKKIIKHLIIPYIIFQTIYLYFDSAILSNSVLTLQYTTPYWILWFLLAIIFYYLIVTLLPKKNVLNASLAIVISITIAILAGYDNSIGYYLSLSRFLVFLPFFVWGYYDDFLRKEYGKYLNGFLMRLMFAFIAIALIWMSESYIFNNNVPTALLYGSYSYDACQSNYISRLVAMGAAFAWIILFLSIIPAKRIPLITAFGQNTMLVFLVHGLIIRYAGKINFFHYDLVTNTKYACIVSIALIIIFGNPLIGKIYKKLL